MDHGRQVFTVDLLERYAAKGHGVITCMAAGNDVIVIGTSKGWVIRLDFGGGDSHEFDLSAGRPGDQSIHRVFVDPGGCHCIATVVGPGGAETFYTHAKWTKPRVLSKLKGLVVNVVAWNRQQITEVSTKEVILGTDNGQLHELAVDEKDKKQRYIKFLYELTELPEALMGLEVSINNEGRDMWKVYLDMKEYAASLANCRDPSQRDQVYSVQAEAAFSSKDYFRAASFYAKINFILSFEEVTLKFIGAGEQDALRTFLLRKLDNLEKEDKCQITMISTWATELYLDKAEYILDLHKQLTLISSEVRRESNCSLASEGSIPSTTSVDKLLSEIFLCHLSFLKKKICMWYHGR